ncbi:unnamed protein product [Timema podura]|uniref:Uncharacterized protein n=1 Tax=Timema podura TaxID=61482 RepID=A0ABN7NPK0_TIMPD|nr:unnamed protein product [Timema podura]
MPGQASMVILTEPRSYRSNQPKIHGYGLKRTFVSPGSNPTTCSGAGTVELTCSCRLLSSSMRASCIASHSLASDSICLLSSSTAGSEFRSTRVPMDSSDLFLPHPRQQSGQLGF